MSAKLYRVRIASMHSNFSKARVWEYWIAATSTGQAKKRAIEQTGWKYDGPLVVTTDCFRGGHAFIKASDLVAIAP